MTKNTRSLVLLLCIALFLIITPYILLYSLGYRVDFKNFKIVPTGGIYVRALPQGVTIHIDSTSNNTTGLFSPYVFLQNLLPGQHHISITKNGYYDYQKNLPVIGNEVTKLEHVILIKKTPVFVALGINIDHFYVSPNGREILSSTTKDGITTFEIINSQTLQKQPLKTTMATSTLQNATWSPDSATVLITTNNGYFLLSPFLAIPKMVPLPYLTNATKVVFNPQNSNQLFFIKNNNLYINSQTNVVVKNVVSYTIIGQHIIWLSTNGLLYNTDTATTTSTAITQTPLPISQTSVYTPYSALGNTFLQQDENVLLLNKDTATFENFYAPVNQIVVSPDNQKILFYNDHEIAYATVNSGTLATIFLNRFSDQIKSLYWLGNDYILFTLGDTIMISEIDTRGNVNTITLPQTIILANNQIITTQSATIFLNQPDKKLYLLSNNILAVSERLVP